MCFYHFDNLNVSQVAAGRVELASEKWLQNVLLGVVFALRTLTTIILEWVPGHKDQSTC